MLLVQLPLLVVKHAKMHNDVGYRFLSVTTATVFPRGMSCQLASYRVHHVVGENFAPHVLEILDHLGAAVEQDNPTHLVDCARHLQHNLNLFNFDTLCQDNPKLNR